ncbi:unnamed protein product, partial [Amoebophrya sp. A25]
LEQERRQAEYERRLWAKDKIVKRWRSNRYARKIRELIRSKDRMSQMQRDAERRAQAKQSLFKMLGDISSGYYYDEAREERESKRFFGYINSLDANTVAQLQTPTRTPASSQEAQKTATTLTRSSDDTEDKVEAEWLWQGMNARRKRAAVVSPRTSSRTSANANVVEVKDELPIRILDHYCRVTHTAARENGAIIQRTTFLR